MTEQPYTSNHPWLGQLVEMLQNPDAAQTQQLLAALQAYETQTAKSARRPTNTPYVNTISTDQQPSFPGDEEIEAQIEGLARWNAMAMVLRANQRDGTIGGHISSYASAATLYEVGFNHFFRGRGAGANR